MGASRFPGKVLVYCRQIAQKIYKKQAWKNDWDSLINSLYSKREQSSLSVELGLPSSIPPFIYDPTDIADLIKEMEDQLNSMAEDGQSAHNDLQSELYSQRETLQLVSGASKMLHDSAMSIIRNIG